MECVTNGDNVIYSKFEDKFGKYAKQHSNKIVERHLGPLLAKKMMP
jgi:hypothetical protein